MLSLLWCVCVSGGGVVNADPTSPTSSTLLSLHGQQ
jgi:hypothetical protein